MVSITFVIPVSPQHFPFEAVQHIRQLSYPENKIEILVVEGKSPSLQRNRAVAKAKGELIYFLDDDSYVDPKSLENSLKYFEDKTVAAVGGPAITYEDASLMEGCFGAALASGFGAGPVKARSRVVGAAREVRGEELILCNLLVRKDLYLSAGGLDISLYPNEENEFLKRLRNQGFKFFYLPDMLVRRSRRKALPQFVKQMLSYGVGRSFHVFKQISFRDIFFFIPSFFTAYLVALTFFASWLAAIPLLLYLSASAGAAFKSARREKSWKLFFVLQAIFPTMHIAYGIGFLDGLTRRWRAAKRKVGGAVPIRILNVSPANVSEVPPAFQPLSKAVDA